ncbi:MAG TPA: hypothetical protein VLL52_18145 [Anaerolineae bacterium]|nr:hypothetical protein [Anaerolineae bacterium]
MGPCSSGKSTLAKALRAAGYEDIRQVAQEHSYVANMWQRITKPDVLIYLDVDYATSRIRRPHIDGGPERVAIQHQRLAHAREHCDFYIDTCDKEPAEIAKAVLSFLRVWEKDR